MINNYVERQQIPSGTVTFLFTDIQGSTQLLSQLGDRYATLLDEHHQLMRATFNQWNGQEIDTQGDAFFVSFPRATQAVSAVVEIQRALAQLQWPDDVEVRVRMGLHTGEPLVAHTGYVGMDVHRAARIAHVGHGGQVLLSETTTALVLDELPEGVELLDLGRHLLKDMRRPEHIRQLVIEGLPAEFPPLTSLEHLPPAELREPRQVGECPYRGLAAFQEEDAPFFFGRESFTDRLYEAVMTQPIVAVIVGSSGSGKSSAVFAGLLPRLRAKGGWGIAVTRPGDQPFYALGSALLPLMAPELSDTDQLLETQKLAEHLTSGEVNLYRIVERILDKGVQNIQILLVIDQFEELYTLCPDVEMHRQFIDQLLAAMEKSSTRRLPPLVILLTMRADFMGQALTHRPFADALQEASLIMGPMSRDELRGAIEAPAEKQGAAFEPGLVERLLDDVGEEPGNLPLLEFALTLSWERQSDGWLTHEDYEALGCVEGALASYADEVYAALSESERQGARRIFVQLVRPGVGTEDTRRLATFAELGEANWDLVRHLADSRLVVTGRDTGTGEETVEVVHEALIQRWGRLRDWMAADRAFRTWQERLRASRRGWEASQRDEGALLRGAPLVEAENWLVERGDDLAPAEQEYIESSAELRQATQARRERRRRNIFFGLATGLVVVLILALLAALNAANARQEKAIAVQHANLATSRELAASALNNLEIDPERSVLLALAALETAHTLEAENALHRAIQASQLELTLTGHAGPVYFLDFSPDGKYLATTSQDQTAKIWDLSTGTEQRTLSGHSDEVFGVDFSPDGSRLATASYDGSARVWDISTGKTLLTLTNPDNLTSVHFSPGGSRLLTNGQYDGTIKVRDAASGEELLSFTAHEMAMWYAVFSPDGKRLATASMDGTAKVWDAATGENLLTLKGQAGAVPRVNYSPDGSRLATSHENGQVKVWDAPSGEELLSIDAHPSIALWVTFSPDGSRLASGGFEGIAKVWDAETGEKLITLAGHNAPILGVSFSPDGTRLATASYDGTVKIWDVSSERELFTLTDHNDWVYSLDFNTQGTQLATGSFDGTAILWDVSDALIPGSPENADLIRALHILGQKGDRDRIRALAYSPDGKRLVTGSAYGSSTMWDVATGRELFNMTGHAPGKTIEGGYFGVTDVDFSPDVNLLATASDDLTAKIWDAHSGEEIFTLSGHGSGSPSRPSMDGVVEVAFSPDGLRLATAGADGTVRLWDTATGLEVLVIDAYPDDGAIAVDFSPNGEHLVTVGYFGETIIWEADAGERLLTLPSQAGLVFKVEFSPDGSLLGTSGQDGFAKIWDVQSGEMLLSLGPFPALFDIAFSPDGNYLVTSGIDGSVRFFVLPLEELITLARSRVSRSLTDEECQQFLHLEVCP
jgi:WD40 repeat protein/class 3 adenylate cyclase